MTQAEEGDTLVRRQVVAVDHPAFAGHFPGNPVLPGVALVAEVMEAILAAPALAARIGARPRLAVAKFAAAVRPGASIEIELKPFGADGRAHHAGGVDFVVRDGDARITASGRFSAAAAVDAP